MRSRTAVGDAADEYTAGQKLSARSHVAEEFRQFTRWAPSYGEFGSEDYLGKLTPGFRPAGLPPVPVIVPDIPKCPWKMVDGRKEFHLYAQPVRREFLPGRWIDVYGFNGSMPGPTLEMMRGDKVRIYLHNQLPEGTTLHFHGAEDDVEEDGVPGITQDLIPPGETFVYDFQIHQAGSFFYHAHVPMQEGMGMFGFIILHPEIEETPPVDRDFALAFQNWIIDPTNTIPLSWKPRGGWQTINGRAGPYATPLVVKHGERVRIRLANFTKARPHAIHLHGHTFWLTGMEGIREPHTAWLARNTEIIHIAQVANIEFIANNPGDWALHCHMTPHMMNFIPQTNTVGPRIRSYQSAADFKRDLEDRPPVEFPHADPGFLVPAYPEQLYAQSFSQQEAAKLTSRRETLGMRENWFQHIQGLMTVVRVLPADLYDRVMGSQEPIAPGEIFHAIGQ